MTAEQLKASILQMAFSGELTADWREENGVELASWQETTSTDLFEYVTSGSRGWNKFYSNRGAFFIRIGNLNHGTIEIDYSKIQYVDLPNKAEGKRSVIKNGDILISITADIGMIGLAKNINYEGYINQHIALARPADVRNAEFIAWYLVSGEGQQQLRNNQRGATKVGIGLDDIRRISISLPPYEEQKEILRRIGIILPLIEEYGNAHAALKKTEEALPDQLRASLLQEAIQGKLVPQIDDEPAVDIAGEEPEDVPFAIPAKWRWVRLGDCTTVNPKISTDDDTDVSFVPMPLLQAGYGSSIDTSNRRKWKEVKKGFTKFCDGDVVLAKITPCFENRKSAIVSNAINGVGAGTTELHVFRCNNDILPEFLLMFFKTSYLIQYGVEHFKGTAGQQRIGTADLKDCPFPLPPLAEQRRIVARLEELLPHVDAIAGVR